MKRDCSVYLQATIFVNGGDPMSSDIIRVTELTEVEARGIKDRFMDEPNIRYDDIKALAPKAEVEFVR